MKKVTIILIFAIIASSVAFAQKGKANGNKHAKIGTEIGDKAPELSYASPTGENIALSSLKGQYVLIDFWASWCGPCRRENPKVVEAYNTYKDAKFEKGKGFTVYGVSLDQNAAAWKAAIEKDKLAWPNHVSDLGGWKSEGAKLYGVSSIPMSYLINGKGIIIAKNLRGAELETELAKHIKAKGNKSKGKGKGKSKSKSKSKKGKSSSK